MGGFLRGVTTGLLTKGNNVAIPIYAGKGFVGGVAGGFVQDMASTMLKNCVCSKKK